MAIQAIPRGTITAVRVRAFCCYNAASRSAWWRWSLSIGVHAMESKSPLLVADYVLTFEGNADDRAQALELAQLKASNVDAMLHDGVNATVPPTPADSGERIEVAE